MGMEVGISVLCLEALISRPQPLRESRALHFSYSDDTLSDGLG